MVWITVDKDGTECVFTHKPKRGIKSGEWLIATYDTYGSTFIELPKGSIEKLIGKELTWNDEPVKLK